MVYVHHSSLPASSQPLRHLSRTEPKRACVYIRAINIYCSDAYFPVYGRRIYYTMYDIMYGTIWTAYDDTSSSSEQQCADMDTQHTHTRTPRVHSILTPYYCCTAAQNKVVTDIPAATLLYVWYHLLYVAVSVVTRRPLAHYWFLWRELIVVCCCERPHLLVRLYFVFCQSYGTYSSIYIYVIKAVNEYVVADHSSITITINWKALRKITA